MLSTQVQPDVVQPALPYRGFVVVVEERVVAVAETFVYVAHSARQIHGDTIRMGKQSDWSVRVTCATNRPISMYHPGWKQHVLLSQTPSIYPD